MPSPQLPDASNALSTLHSLAAQGACFACSVESENASGPHPAVPDGQSGLGACPPSMRRALALVLWGLGMGLAGTGPVHAEGSRTLYPATYPTSGGSCANVADRGCRAHMDLQPGTRYLGKVQRRTFLYVYAEAGEYVLLGSSNRSAGGDILVYNPQDFGTPGDETLPVAADFSCASSTPPAGSFSGGSLGQLGTRAEELAGPHSADGTVTVTNGFAPCAYRAPVSGIYGVQFLPAASGPTNLTADVLAPIASSNTAAAWDVSVRASANSVVNLDGRLFTYAWVAFTGVNDRPVFSRQDYVTLDGFRYSQSLAGLDPNGFALYANRLGFLDNGQPLYKGVRGSDSLVTNLAVGLSAQRPEFPLFFSSVAPSAPHATQVNKVLSALQIPLTPQTPSVSSASFIGRAPSTNAHTRTGMGGTFQLSIAGASTFQIVVSRDGTDFSPANVANAVITGIATNGRQVVAWDGNDVAGAAFAPSATPYAYRVFARAGEIHLPMIDAENNGDGASPATATFGGGPTITKLNGPLAGDTTVYFDDRGYVTRSGTLVGQVNGSLCPSTPPFSPSPAQALDGTDSALVYGAAPRLYRWWFPGINANADCAAAAGWGDGKGLDLWAYLSSPPSAGTLWVDPSQRDAMARVFVPTTARPGTTVQGRLEFTNQGADAVTGLQYALTLDRSCADTALSFANLPGGASALCTDVLGQGRYVLSGLPTALAGGASVTGADPAAPLTFSYTAPGTGVVSATAAIATAPPDDDSTNNSAAGTTVISAVDVQTSASAPLTALAGAQVTVQVSFANLSGAPAAPWAPSVTVGAPANCPATVQLVSAPPGVAATGVDPATCTVELSGMPSTLADGQILSLTLRYTAPALGWVPVTSSVTAAADSYTANNTATATTAIAVVNMVASLAGMPAQAVPGQPYAGSFSCTNTGLLDAVAGTQCTLDSGLPAGLTVTGCTLDRTGAAWSAGDAVPAGARVVCSVSGTPTALGQLTLVVTASATGDAVPSDNTATQPLAAVASQAIPALTPAGILMLAALVGLAFLRRTPS